MEKTREGMTEEVKKPKKQYKPSDFKLGETVKVLSMNLTGTVHSLPDTKGNLMVQMGILSSKVHISDLEIVDEKPAYLKKTAARTSKGKVKMGKSLSVSPEINLLGKTVDEAVAELDKYLDDASLAHLTSVRVVHGKRNRSFKSGYPPISETPEACEILQIRSIWRRRCRSDDCRTEIMQKSGSIPVIQK